MLNGLASTRADRFLWPCERRGDAGLPDGDARSGERRGGRVDHGPGRFRDAGETDRVGTTAANVPNSLAAWAKHRKAMAVTSWCASIP
jgi:hypothetical protein